MNEKVNITINSTIIYVTAFITSTMLHEAGHAVTSYILDGNPVLHHNYVKHLTPENISSAGNLTILLAGPLFSLFSGLISGYLFLRIKKQNLLTLFLLWFSIFGLNNFLGYIMTGPFAKAGDIGKVYSNLATPATIQIILLILSAGLLLLIAYKLTVPFLQFSYKEEWLNNGSERKKFSFGILILPWIIGSILVTVLYLPVVAVISIIYPFMSGFIFIYPWQNANRIENIAVTGSNTLGKISFKNIFFLVILILIFRLVLAPGIEL